MRGKVYLVGAGPGDPGLLTLKGRDCLARADVVVYDRLVSPSILKFAPAGAELVYAGKSPEGHTLTQEEINALLVARARAGATVVRLKGGDPFVFGRGGEEAEALAAAGVPFEVVPGVTAAVAVPAYAGIPVTHRQYTSSLAIVTGHEADGDAPPALRWEALAHAAGTLVFLMGTRNLPEIVARLTAAGLPAETPVAVIRWGTLPRQRTVTGTLGDIAERAKGVANPAVVVVGRVVELRERLSWFEKGPLFGRRVLVTRTREQAGDLVRIVESLGGEALVFPTIKVAGPEDPEPLDRALGELAGFDWVVFTSANGVRFFWRRLVDRGYDARAFGRARLAAIGPKTGAALEAFGLRPDFVASEYRAEVLAAGLGSVARPGQKVLLARAAGSREVLARELARLGLEVTEVHVYRTLPAGEDGKRIAELLRRGEVDAVTFTSSSTVRNFLSALGPDAGELLRRTAVACIGPVTAATAEELGLRVDVVAREYTVEGLAEALCRYFAGGGAVA